MSSERADLLALLMRAASATAEQLNVAVVDAGYAGLRPAHGLVFACVADGGASVSQIGEHLAITKQSAAAIVEELVAAGYLARGPHPQDRRAHLVTLTRRGRAATEVATRVARQQWRDLAGAFDPKSLDRLADVLAVLGREGRLHPVW
jgi:DNA-binding MarR family transcriptional regulator